MAKVKTDCEWELFEELKELLGEDYLLLSIAKAMGTWELAENLEFICRMEDIGSEYLEDEE